MSNECLKPGCCAPRMQRRREDVHVQGQPGAAPRGPALCAPPRARNLDYPEPAGPGGPRGRAGEVGALQLPPLALHSLVRTGHHQGVQLVR